MILNDFQNINFKLIKEKYNVDSNDLLFVTDTSGDIREAEEAGVPTIGVTWGGHDRHYLTRGGHKNIVKIVDTVAELEGFIFSA